MDPDLERSWQVPVPKGSRRRAMVPFSSSGVTARRATMEDCGRMVADGGTAVPGCGEGGDLAVSHAAVAGDR